METLLSGPARGPRAAVKLSDVAAAAGVAPMTVSRVINTPDRVSPATAARVRSAIEKLGYVPNLVAGGLSSRRSRMVAAIVPTIAHPMFAEMVQHFTDTMREAGYQVMLSLSGYNDFGGVDLVRGLLARRPDAMLVTGANHRPPVRQLLTEAGIPVVEIWDTAPDPVDMLVGLDHAEAGGAVAAMFRAKGIGHFAAFGAADARAQARLHGFTQAARRAGGIVVAEHVLPAPSTITAGRQAMAALAAALTERTGLFCSSDMLAFGAMTEARIRGIAVPARLCVCGFGDFELGAANDPPFTTVSVEGAEVGRTAAGMLLRRLGGAPQSDADRVHVPFRILERAST